MRLLQWRESTEATTWYLDERENCSATRSKCKRIEIPKLWEGVFFKSSSHNFNWQEITTSKFEALARRRVKVDWGNQRTVRGDKETGCSETGLIFFSRVRFSIFTNWNLKQNSMVTSKSLSLWVHGLLTILLYVTKPFEDVGSFRTGCSSTYYNYCLIDLDDWWDHRSSNEIPSRTVLLCTYEKRMVRFILNSCLLEQGLIIIDNKRP